MRWTVFSLPCIHAPSCRKITKAELAAHFRGNTKEADDCLAMMDGFDARHQGYPANGIITISEFRHYFQCAAEFDTNDPCTSPMAAKALSALEYAPSLKKNKSETDLAAANGLINAASSYAHEIAEAAKNGRRLSLAATHNFWGRADMVFNFIDAKGNGDGRVSRDELIAHFRGNTEEADYYMDQIDGFEPEDKGDTLPDGLLDISEWHEFFNFCAEVDTGNPETSPAAAKALAALEYAETQGDVKKRKQRKIQVVATANFWMRVTALFEAIDDIHDCNGRVTKQEIIDFFHGNTAEADQYINLIDQFKKKRRASVSASDQSKVGNDDISLEEWQDFFRYVAEEDTEVAETSPAACKVLSALEYVLKPTLPPNNDDKMVKPAAKGQIPTHKFWKRVDAVFDFIDSKGDGDGRISREELTHHFRGNNKEVDYHMDLIDGFVDSHTEEAPDGFISRAEWHHYFEFLAEEDTGHAETSPLCAKTIAAIEYAHSHDAHGFPHSGRDRSKATATAATDLLLATAKRDGWSAPTTTNFWVRVTDLFHTIAAKDGSEGKDRITRGEMVAHFHGNTAEADLYMELLDGFTFQTEQGQDDEAHGTESPDGYLTLEEWHNFFRMVAQVDTGLPETSPAACKALAALEYVPTAEDRTQYLNQHSPGSAKASSLTTAARSPALLASDGSNQQRRLSLMASVETHAFWKRVDAVFLAIDSKGVANEQITRDEMLAHFRGRSHTASSDVEAKLAREVDYYMEQMDGFIGDNKEEAADGIITPQEWRNYFHFVAEEDTGKPETSPACAKTLSALEYAELYKPKKQRSAVETYRTHREHVHAQAAREELRRQAGEALQHEQQQRKAIEHDRKRCKLLVRVLTTRILRAVSTKLA